MKNELECSYRGGTGLLFKSGNDRTPFPPRRGGAGDNLDRLDLALRQESSRRRQLAPNYQAKPVKA